MTATIIDGIRVADTVLADVRRRATEFETTAGRKPCLATVLVGDDPASHTYVRMKTNRCRTAGLDSRSFHLAKTVTTSEVIALVNDVAQVLGHFLIDLDTTTCLVVHVRRRYCVRRTQTRLDGLALIRTGHQLPLSDV